jgi:hypothetical protein
MRNKGEEECGRLRIERLDDDAFAKCPMRAGRVHFGWFNDAARFSPCLEPEPHEIKGSCDLQQCERLSARHHECGDTDRAGKNMDKTAETKADARCEPFCPAAGKRSRGSIEEAGPWSDRHEQRRRQEDEEGLDVRHRLPRCNGLNLDQIYWTSQRRNDDGCYSWRLSRRPTLLSDCRKHGCVARTRQIDGQGHGRLSNDAGIATKKATHRARLADERSN